MYPKEFWRKQDAIAVMKQKIADRLPEPKGEYTGGKLI